jgi:choline-glycine betaine transporter
VCQRVSVRVYRCGYFVTLLAAVYFVIVLFIFDPRRTNVGVGNHFMLISTSFYQWIFWLTCLCFVSGCVCIAIDIIILIRMTSSSSSV